MLRRSHVEDVMKDPVHWTCHCFCQVGGVYWVGGVHWMGGAYWVGGVHWMGGAYWVGGVHWMGGSTCHILLPVPLQCKRRVASKMSLALARS